MSATLRSESLLAVEALECPSLIRTSDRAVSSQRLEALKPGPGSGYSGVEEHSTPFHSFLEHSNFLLFPIVFGLALYFSLARLYHLDNLWWALLAIPMGIVGGDLVSGLIHWFADTYFSEDTPIIGRSLVKPFRLHHLYPRDICTHNVVVTLGNSCILAVPVLAICLYLLWLLPQSGWLAFKVLFITLLAAATVATNQFHKWAHHENPSSLIRWLQRKRLVLEPSHHEQHHTAPFNVHYCISNGWLNPFLNRIKFFRRLEAGLSVFGVRPSNRHALHKM
jgi:hypothetical protein